MAEEANSFQQLLPSLKSAAAALRDAEIPFLLAGGIASWALGGPETVHDVDFMLKPTDADRALDVLEAAGMRPERPPEEWLYKVYDGDVMIDLIFEPAGLEITDEVIERSPVREVFAVAMRVLPAEDILVTKLMAMKEHEIDYDPVLEIARSLREQIDWDYVRELTRDSPYAKAFFTLVEELGIV
jgi:hypothetical protein